VAEIAERKRLIYHYRRALETLAEEPDLYPRRLFTAMFPLFQVRVRGQERRAEDYEELEWFIARAIGYAKVGSVTALRDFYGLDEQLVRDIVEVLKSIGHLVEREDHRLMLTRLGRESLAEERRYEMYESEQILYFDAYTCRPLPRSHYRLRFFASGELRDEDRALYSFEPWRSEALDELARRPDRAEYHVRDEVQTLEALGVGSAYLPMHIVEAARQGGEQTLRVFTNVRGRRDLFFESLLEKHPEIVAPLLDDHRLPQQVIGHGLAGMGLSKGSYRLNRAASGEWRVTVPEYWVKSRRPDGVERLADLGEYVFAASYCVRVWSDDPDLRYRAACVRLLDRLEHIRRELAPAEVRRHIDGIFTGLEVRAADVETLMEIARDRGLGRAMEKLEGLVDEG
jgi:hypothetical protein